MGLDAELPSGFIVPGFGEKTSGYTIRNCLMTGVEALKPSKET